MGTLYYTIMVHRKDDEVSGGYMSESISNTGAYGEYISTHGYHFTDALSEYASSLMVNANGDKHTWTVQQVMDTIAGLNITIPEGISPGDIAYTSNMAYADFYPDVVKDEACCIRYAYAVATDPDGYDGMIFKRWVADIVGKNIDIDWDKYL